MAWREPAPFPKPVPAGSYRYGASNRGVRRIFSRGGGGGLKYFAPENLKIAPAEKSLSGWGGGEADTFFFFFLIIKKKKKGGGGGFSFF